MRYNSTLRLFLSLISALIAIVVIGCSSQSEEAYTTQPSPTGNQQPINQEVVKIKLEQLPNLKSEIKRVETKDGLVFLLFDYLDNDGKVYKVELPEPLASGEFTQDQWISTFSSYKSLTTTKIEKKPKKKINHEIEDFPFISPRQKTNESSEQRGNPEASLAGPSSKTANN